MKKKPVIKKKKVYTPPSKKVDMKGVYFVGKSTT
jgi:hypothetical protein